MCQRGLSLVAAVPVVTVIFFWSSGVSGRTWYVPSECPTIPAGLDSASYGDTVLVAPGTYLETGDPETWISLDPGVCLVSENGAEVTIIEFCNTTVGVGFGDCEGAHLSGFTIRFAVRPGCGSPGALTSGIYCYSCTDVTVESCIIENVVYGIYVNGESQEWWKPVFANNIIRNCTAGIKCRDIHEAGRPFFIGNTVTDCDVGVEVWDSEPNFESCEIEYSRDYGMIYLGHCGGNLDECVIAHNESYGVLIDSDPPLAVPSFNGSWLPENANDFYDNGSWDIWYAHSHDLSGVMALYNYWGADCPAFEAKLHGRIIYSPWMDSTHTIALTEDDCPGAVEASTWGKIKAMFR